MTLSPMRRTSDLLRSLFGRDFRHFFEPLFDEESVPHREGFMPPIDVFHNDENITVRVEAPGVRKEDLDIHVEGDLLTISGKKEHVESSNYHQIESRCGVFRRSLTLPHAVDRDKIAANYKDGVLTLSLPLTPEAKLRQIEVKID